jgi:hypothetical protein
MHHTQRSVPTAHSGLNVRQQSDIGATRLPSFWLSDLKKPILAMYAIALVIETPHRELKIKKMVKKSSQGKNFFI